MKIGCIVLARFSSSRLPGKALRPLQGKALLHRVYDALAPYFEPSQIVVATSDEPSDTPIVEYCRQQGITYYRGSLDNVAQRFADCANAHRMDYAFRINGDNLFVEITSLLDMKLAVAEDSSLDFLSNVEGRTYPYGMSVELVKTSFYQSVLHRIGRDARYREHVTLYLYDHPAEGRRLYFYNEKYPEAQAIPLAIDTPKDFGLAEMMLAEIAEGHSKETLADIVSLYHKANQQYEQDLAG